MRVLIGTDCVGGVWTYSLELSRALAERGVDVSLATMGGRLSAAQRREAYRAPLRSLDTSEYALEWMPDPWRDVDASGDWLLERAAQHAVDVVHLSTYAHAALDWPVPTVLVGHSCVWSWWRAVHGTDPPPEWNRYRERVRDGLAAADAVVAPTEAMAAELRRHYGVEEVAVIPNGVSAPSAGSLRREPFVLAAGRLWDPAKNLATLDAVAGDLQWPVLAAGALGDGQWARAVRPLGELSRAELRWLAERAAIFTAPARYEPFGLAAVEAARAGCALVLGDIPSLREVWGEAALYVDPDDRRALRRTLRRLIAEPDMRRALAVAARRRSRRYRPPVMAEAYRGVYASLVEREGVAA
jgi:glycogen(starch) synthase